MTGWMTKTDRLIRCVVTTLPSVVKHTNQNVILCVATKPIRKSLVAVFFNNELAVVNQVSLGKLLTPKKKKSEFRRM